MNRLSGSWDSCQDPGTKSMKVCSLGRWYLIASCAVSCPSVSFEVAMLACIGYIVPEYFRWPGEFVQRSMDFNVSSSSYTLVDGLLKGFIRNLTIKDGHMLISLKNGGWWVNLVSSASWYIGDSGKPKVRKL